MRDRITRLHRAAGTALLGCFVAAAQAAPVTTQFGVTGVSAPSTYDLDRLASLPATTQTDTFVSGATPTVVTYTGTSLWTLLDDAGIVTNPAVKNDVLNKFVLATGSDGYRVVYSLGELNPNFGNQPDLVAYRQIAGGVTSGLGADGFARVTAPNDIKGGRYLSNLTALQVQSSASQQTGSGGGPSTTFAVSGAVTAAKTFDLAALQALPVTTETVGTTTYTGVSLWDLLTSTVGISTDPSVKNDILDKYVVATGSDGYRVVFSLGELDPAFGAQPDLIAYLADGAGLGADGFARIVVPDDVRAGRRVSDLVSLEVFSAVAVPEPGTVALLFGGLGGIMLVARRGTRSISSAASASARRSPQ